MERGLYIAASGMVAEMVRQDQIANDLANASTPGYRGDRTTQRSFGDLLLSNQATGRTVGPLGMGVEVDRIVTDTTAGPIRSTGEALDFAIEGDGFFAVQTPQGVRYTRNGRFTEAADGTLVTALGQRVLGPGGAAVRVQPGGSVDPNALGVFTLRTARKQGDSLFTGTAPTPVAPGAPGAGRVLAQALEGSAADPARALVDMIGSFRAFEAGQKVIATIDETLSKATNQVGSPRGG
jgi:flagellar basal-body rod protein FlgF